MLPVSLPKGARVLDLVEQRRGRLVFAPPRDDAGARRMTDVLTGANGAIAAVMAFGVVFAVVMAGAFVLAAFLALLVVLAAGANYYLSDFSPFRTEEIVIDLKEREVRLPATNHVAGTHKLEDVDLVLVADDAAGFAGDANSHHWWLALEFSLGRTMEGEHTAQVRLWGPAFRGDALVAQTALQQAMGR